MLTVILRSILLVLMAIFSLRMMGKRQIGQLQPFELVIAFMIADLATTPMESLDIPLWRGILPMLLLIVLHQTFSLLSMKSQRLRAFFSGRPTVVIRRGQIDHKALEKLCFNLNDLLEELRDRGMQSPTEVGSAIMETSGKLSVFPASGRRSVTPQDLGLNTGYEGVPLTLILDGQVEKQNLHVLGKDSSWLEKTIRSGAKAAFQDVLLCYADTDGQMTVHLYGGKTPLRFPALKPEEVCW